MQLKDLKGYSVKNVKKFSGHEGEPCHSGSLYRGTKRIATFTEDTWGGPTILHFKPAEEEKLFQETVKALPPATFDFGAGEQAMSYNDDMFIGELLEDFFLRKDCKKKTLFRLKGDKSDQYWTVKVAFSPLVKVRLQERHGDDLVEIINERYA